jgi:hypothetical protein
MENMVCADTKVEVMLRVNGIAQRLRSDSRVTLPRRAARRARSDGDEENCDQGARSLSSPVRRL